MSFFIVEDDEGKVLNANYHFDNTMIDAILYDEPIEPKLDSRTYGGHVVELVKSPTKVVVSEEEDEMLKQAKNTTEWRPASVIAGYAYEHEQQADDEVLLEDRLMRAYVIGWTVENLKLWNVKVPHVNNGYYYKDSDGLAVFTAKRGRMLQERSQFTLEEIEHYGLQYCEKTEVPNED